MGIAAEQAGLSRQPLADRVNGKNILCGLAAGQAIHSAFAAQAGIKGSPNFLSGVYGLNATFAEGNADLEKGLSELGKKFSVSETSIKLYPSCRSTHPGLDLTFDMMEGSKTGKAAEADVIIGVGFRNQLDIDQDIRSIAVSKNKITGYHGKMTCKIIPELSRYID